MTDIMSDAHGLMVEREIVLQDKFIEKDEATDFIDNLGFSVIMPGGNLLFIF